MQKHEFAAGFQPADLPIYIECRATSCHKLASFSDFVRQTGLMQNERLLDAKHP